MVLSTITSRSPIAALPDTETLATRLLADCTVVECTVTPAPNVARVVPCVNRELGDPVTRTDTFAAPGAALATSGRCRLTMSNGRLSLSSPLIRLTT